MIKNPNVTGLLELSRVGLLALIASVVVSLQAGEPNWTVILVTGAIAAYRALSTYVADNPDIPLKGLFIK